MVPTHTIKSRTHAITIFWVEESGVVKTKGEFKRVTILSSIK